MNVTVGTSGWLYKHWKGTFYPEDLKGNQWFEYYLTKFNSVELNSPFYRLPKAQTVQDWHDKVPEDFIYAIKMNRYITHTKRLKADEITEVRLREFFELMKPLGKKLGVILVQLPPTMKVEPSRIKFLADVRDSAEQELGMKIPLAVEFRHESWFTPEMYYLLEQNNIANVLSDGAKRWPTSLTPTSDFIYIRLHGSEELYKTKYTDEQLENYKLYINRINKPAFIYFDNDYKGRAAHDALTMRELVNER